MTSIPDRQIDPAESVDPEEVYCERIGCGELAEYRGVREGNGTVDLCERHMVAELDLGGSPGCAGGTEGGP